MLVAVIDDGIIPDKFSVGTLKFDMFVTENERVRRRKPSEQITTLHGTIVSGIIKKYAPEVEFCSVRVFSNGIMLTTCGKLGAALKWCLKMKIPLINLSLGTVDPEDFIKVQKITDRLLNNGQTIVAACNINGEYTVPAMLPGVIGVRTDTKLSGDEFIPINGKEGVNYIASSIHQLSFTDGNSFKTPLSNSYAAPTITAAVMSGRLPTNHKSII